MNTKNQQNPQYNNKVLTEEERYTAFSIANNTSKMLLHGSGIFKLGKVAVKFVSWDKESYKKKADISFYIEINKLRLLSYKLKQYCNYKLQETVAGKSRNGLEKLLKNDAAANKDQYILYGGTVREGVVIAKRFVIEASNNSRKALSFKVYEGTGVKEANGTIRSDFKGNDKCLYFELSLDEVLDFALGCDSLVEFYYANRYRTEFHKGTINRLNKILQGQL